MVTLSAKVTYPRAILKLGESVTYIVQNGLIDEIKLLISVICPLNSKYHALIILWQFSDDVRLKHLSK